jgi:glycogen synthase
VAITLGSPERLFKSNGFFISLLFQKLVGKKREVIMLSRGSHHTRKIDVKGKLLHCTRLHNCYQKVLYNTGIVRKKEAFVVCNPQKGPSLNQSFQNIVKEQTLSIFADKIIPTILEKPLEPFVRVLKEYRSMVWQFSETTCQDIEKFNKSSGQILHKVVMESKKFEYTMNFDKKLWKSFCSPQGGGSEAYMKMCEERSKLARKLVEKMVEVKMTCQNSDLVELASQFLDVNQLGPVVFITAELEHWSSVGGLGVMVNNLTRSLTKLYHQNVYVITPWYQRDTNGRHDEEHYGKNIRFHSRFRVRVGGEMIEIDLYEASHENVNILLLRNKKYFYSVYQKGDISDSLRYLVVTAKASLEALCQRNLIPSLMITNDWPSGLVPAYGKNSYFFGDVFKNTTFFHLIHNLGTHYEGRIYADSHSIHEYSWITELSTELLVDPFWDHVIFNPSRCCLLCCDTWGTVSPSYADELQYSGNSPLAPLLTRFSNPFAYPNGADKDKSIQMLKKISVDRHDQAKTIIQTKYFNLPKPDLNIPLFAFIGRITKQKGIDLIVDSVEQLIMLNDCRVHFLIAGKADKTDEHAVQVVQKMQRIRMMYPSCFWINPDDFFTDGSLINLGADLALMPSQFEPGGIVQHEFFIAGTPVLGTRIIFLCIDSKIYMFLSSF